jgi:predicted transcriptional regulator/DNA-binding XRE family transcriptional regulator
MPDAIDRMIGAKLKRARNYTGFSQAKLAEELGVHTTAVAHFEAGRRSLTPRQRQDIARVLKIDPDDLSRDNQDTEIFELLAEMVSDPLLQQGQHISPGSAEYLYAEPNLASAIARLYERYREYVARDHAGEQGAPTEIKTPQRQVNDFLQRVGNHFAELEEQAQRLWRVAHLQQGDVAHGLRHHLEQVHGLRVEVVAQDEAMIVGDDSVIRISRVLPVSGRAFHLARAIAQLDHGGWIRRCIDESELARDVRARGYGVSALEKYFAGAVLMPEVEIRSEALACEFDIGKLRARFDTSYEQVCHRLTTLGGDDMIRFHFIRLNAAGVLDKSFARNSLAFPRYTNVCALWVVHDAMTTPRRLQVQISDMWLGAGVSKQYFCVARSVRKKGRGGHYVPSARFAVGLGCELDELRQRKRDGRPGWAYAKGLDLDATEPWVRVGKACARCGWEPCRMRTEPYGGD